MRVAMISEHASPLAALGGPDAGGQNTHVAELAAALADQGHDVRVYTRRDEPHQDPVVPLGDGVKVLHVPAGPAEPTPKDELPPYMPEFGRWLVRHWEDDVWRPDVVHAHFWMSGLAALTAGRQTGVPVVQTYHALGTVKRRHQGAADTSPPRRIRYERMLGRSVDRVIAQCADEVDELTRMGIRRSAITVVPSGVNQRIFTPDGPAARRDPGRPRLLGVGRLVDRKGFQDAVRALRAVPEAEYVLVGGPPAARLTDDGYARRLRALAASEGVADRVHLVGAIPREEMARWYRSADLLVATPWYEPFGLTPLEAMACATPVVGTAVGGLTDTVVPGVTGDLVPPRDPEALGAALRRLLADADRRRRYGVAAVERIRTGYSWTRTATRLSAVYTAVCGAPQTSGAVA
ncbi:glycosyltransferase family 1 protein [Micromonospora noduli]|uniref:glycosyltransferase n=1 Tax=Micromonospora noduli TaxID=709876 RepID=UPI00124B29B2|nr:glycosyltransferase [Micromonospora noduli]KAB1921267.1 glycosyltransferase family 1 protein [Micromonospora noduli]